MTVADERRLLKNYEMRRAGLMPADEAADTTFLDLLRIVGRDSAGQVVPARKLTPQEKELHRLGQLANTIRGEIVPASVAAELEQSRLGKERAVATTKAKKAEAEARRLGLEAARLRGNA